MTASGATDGLIDWDLIDVNTLHEGVQSQRLDSHQLTIIRYQIAQGAAYPLHHHEQEQFVQGISGEVAFSMGETSMNVRPGDLVCVPPGVPHGAASPDGVSVFLSISPRRRHE